MTKQEFIEFVENKRAVWLKMQSVEENYRNLMSVCYDILNGDEELSNISTELAITKQQLEETKQEVATLKTYKSGFSRLYTENEKLQKEMTAYKGIVKAQNVLIELK